MMLEIRQQNPDDEDSVESLMREAFGDVRYARSVWALRPGPPVQRLCLMGVDDGVAVGSLRFWEIMLGEARILLLGPLAVRPEMRGKGRLYWFRASHIIIPSSALCQPQTINSTGQDS
jgi:predicted N-acetyltransferase YhbS